MLPDAGEQDGEQQEDVAVFASGKKVRRVRKIGFCSPM